MYENSRFLKNRFTFCGVNTNFGQQWAPPAYYHLTPIVSKGKHCVRIHSTMNDPCIGAWPIKHGYVTLYANVSCYFLNIYIRQYVFGFGSDNP